LTIIKIILHHHPVMLIHLHKGLSHFHSLQHIRLHLVLLKFLRYIRHVSSWHNHLRVYHLRIISHMIIRRHALLVQLLRSNLSTSLYILFDYLLILLFLHMLYLNLLLLQRLMNLNHFLLLVLALLEEYF